MKNPNPALKKNDVRKIGRSCGIAYARAMLPTPRVRSTAKCLMCLLVSSNWNSTCAVFADARMAANQKGVAALNHETTEGSASTPPRNGPMMKPTPNAAPIIPKFFVRSCGDVTSAMAA